MNHSYVTQGSYQVNVTAWNLISSTIKVTNVVVMKPVVLLEGLTVASSPAATNFSVPVKFILKLSKGSDFQCTFSFGDEKVIEKAPDCYNLTYYKDGITSDTTPFENLEFQSEHNYSSIGNYTVKVFCSNRLSNASYIALATVQNPIEGFHLPDIPPQIWGNSFPLLWNITQGTNVTFTLKFKGAVVYSSTKTDKGDTFTILSSHYGPVGVYDIELQAENLVSQVSKTTTVIIQEEITTISLYTYVITSDFGSGIKGFGSENHIFPAEYPINFTAAVDKGTNLTYWWRFKSEDDRNITESTTTYQFPDAVQDYVVNVTAYNLVSSKTASIKVKTEKSVRKLAVSNDSPTEVNKTTTFELTIGRFGTGTCFTWDMGDGSPLSVQGGLHCNASHPGRTFTQVNEDTPKITVTHVYRTKDEFKVQVNASNKVSRQIVEDKVVILALTCEYPNVTMTGA